MANTTFLFSQICAYVPTFVTRRILAHPGQSPANWQERRPAAVLFADVSGFTAMSESLAALGKEGAEELTRILNAYFSEMIALVYAYQGDVVRFGGDAITCVFGAPAAAGRPLLPGDETALLNAALRRAVACALAMQAHMAKFRRVQTRGGDFELRMKIGISAGRVLGLCLGDPALGLAMLLAGQALDRMSLAEHHAAAGEVLIDAQALQQAGLSLEEMDLRLREERQGFWAVERFVSQPLPETSPTLPLLPPEGESASALQALISFLPPTVYERLVEGQRQFVGEHRGVASLFVHFAGPDYDQDPRAGDQVQAYFCAMQGIIQRYGGRLNWISAGDKGHLLHVLFGAPVALEDPEASAVGCALAMRDAEPAHFPMSFGVASGPVFAGEVGSERRREYTVMGDVVNLSARLMQAASPGEILLDRRTARRAREQYECQGLPPLALKGKRDPVPVWRAVGPHPENADLDLADLRLLSAPLVGRDRELDHIEALIWKARAGQGQLVTISGEAGVGKSRLLETLVSRARQEELRALKGECFAYTTQAAYAPWLPLLRDLLGTSASGAESRGGWQQELLHIAQTLAGVDAALADWVPIIGQLLGLPVEDNALTAALEPQLRKQRLFDIVLTLVLSQARQVPLLLIVFEDVHWADALSIELLHYVARNIRHAPILLAAVYRPTISFEEWQAYDFLTTFELGDLRADDAMQLVQLKLGMESVPAALQAALLRGEGHVNAFYLEEVLNALIERGYLAPAPQGTGYCVTRDLSQVEIPASVQSLVMSRIDQLDESSKLSIKVAAVIGRTFPYRALASIYPTEISSERLHANLERLSRLDLTPLERPAPEWEYFFKHVITQEVAYESLLYAHRRALHQRMGEYLEQTYTGRLAEVYDLLAHHYTHSEDLAKSWEYLVKSGDQARGRYANESAVRYYQQALAIRPEAGVFEALGEVQYLVGEFEAAIRAYEQALEMGLPARHTADLRRKIGMAWELQGQHETALEHLRAAGGLLAAGERQTPEMARICKDIGWVEVQTGNYEAAQRWCQEGLDIAARLPAAAGRKAMADLHNTFGTIYLRQGTYEAAVTHYEQCVRIREKLNDLYGQSGTYVNLAVAYWSQGDYARASGYLQKSLSIHQKIGHAYGMALCYNNIGVICYTTGDYPRAVQHYQHSLEIRQRIGDRQGIGDVYNNLGEVYHALGEIQKSLEYLQQASQLYEELGIQDALLDTYKLLAEVHLELEQPAEALAYAHKSRALAVELGQREYEGIAQRVLGHIQQTSGQGEQAIACLQASVAILEDSGNRLELGKSCYELGLALRAGDPALAQQRLEQAAAIFEEVGVPVELEKARSALAAVTPPPAARE